MTVHRRSTATAVTQAQLPSIALHKLPVQLRMLVRVMGEASAYRLVELRGGTPYTVPQSLFSPAGQVLVEMVGASPAAALIAELPGQTLQLPKNDSVLRQLRHQRVLELRAQGLKLATIALATGYTVRQVINICQRSGLGLLLVDEPTGPTQHDLWPELLDDEPDDQADQVDTAPARSPSADLRPAQPTAHNPFGLRGAATGQDSPEAL